MRFCAGIHPTAANNSKHTASSKTKRRPNFASWIKPDQPRLIGDNVMHLLKELWLGWSQHRVFRRCDNHFPTYLTLHGLGRILNQNSHGSIPSGAASRTVAHFFFASGFVVRTSLTFLSSAALTAGVCRAALIPRCVVIPATI
jgi:hypothetical protein